MGARVASLALAAACSLAACDSRESLPPLPAPDRVSLGELHKDQAAGDITDPAVAAQAVALANELRARAWSREKASHGGCETVVLTFLVKDRPVGYLALEGGAFFTNGTQGEVQQPADAAARQRFLALLPRWFEPTKCMA